MKIEFLETDDTGEHVIIVIDGRRKIIPTSKTVKEIMETKFLHTAPAVLDGDRPSGPVEIQPGDTLNVSTQIQRNDTVKFLGFPQEDGTMGGDESGDLVAGGLYKVIDVNKYTVAIINPASDFPIRLTVNKANLVLVEKGERVTQKKQVFEMLAKCTCGQDMALEKQKEGNYMGICPKCHEIKVSPVN